MTPQQHAECWRIKQAMQELVEELFAVVKTTRDRELRAQAINIEDAVSDLSTMLVLRPPKQKATPRSEPDPDNGHAA